MKKIWKENKQKIFGFYEFWFYCSVPWIGYECNSPTYEKTLDESFRNFSRGVYKFTICWLIPPLGIKMLIDEWKTLDFSSSIDY